MEFLGHCDLWLAKVVEEAEVLKVEDVEDVPDHLELLGRALNRYLEAFLVLEGPLVKDLKHE